MFADLIAEDMQSDGKVTTSEEAGTTFWTLAGEIPFFQPTLALNDRHMLFGLNADTVKTALRNAKGGPANLAGRSEYQASVKTVASVDLGLLYVDMKTLFERLYEKFRPMAAFALMGQPEIAKHFDATKLPQAATISRHLKPLIFSYSHAEGGMQAECTGTVSLFQSYVPLVTGAAFFMVRGRAVPPPAPAPAPPVRQQ
jgi:hypothetical protein